LWRVTCCVSVLPFARSASLRDHDADGFGEGAGGHAGEGVVVAEGFAQVVGVAEDEVADVAEAPACEAEGADEVLLRGAEDELVGAELDGEDGELPGLAAGDEVEGGAGD